MHSLSTSTASSTSPSAFTSRPVSDVLLGASALRVSTPPAPCPPAEYPEPQRVHPHALPSSQGQPAPVPNRAADADRGKDVRRCRRCLCVLSRYNEEPYCSSCSRRARHQPAPVPYVPTDVWASAEVQEALLARDFGRLCQLVRVASGLRQSDMAELTGLSQAFLSMLESGARRLTNIDKIVELLVGLNTPAELTGPMLRTSNGTGEESGQGQATRG